MSHVHIYLYSVLWLWYICFISTLSSKAGGTISSTVFGSNHGGHIYQMYYMKHISTLLCVHIPMSFSGLKACNIIHWALMGV